MFQTLPCEIVTAIAELLSPADVRSLSQVCSKFYSDLLPLSYRTLDFQAPNEWALNLLNSDSFFRTHQQSTDNFHLLFTKDLSFSAPFQIARFNRCVYHSPYPTSGWFNQCGLIVPFNEEKAHAQLLDDISRQVQQVLKHLAEHRLQSFKWHLGICIPPGLFDASGLLVNRQTNIEHLSLITDGSCPHAGGAVEELPRFSRLKSLSWEGIQHESELKSLGNSIRRNHQSLVKLSIRFAVSFTDFDVIHSIFGIDVSSGLIFEGCINSWENCFPRFQHLCLSKALLQQHLDPGFEGILGHLRSLSLRNCRNDLVFLQSLARSTNEIHIQWFEFCCDMLQYSWSDLKGQPLAAFLNSFSGLKHLQLKLSSFPSEAQLKSAITHHRSSLETLVYHERSLQSIDAEGPFLESRDKNLAWCPQLPQVIDLGRVSALAFCVSPSVLRSVLEPISTNISLRILHLRWSGTERIHRNVRHELMSRLVPAQTYRACDQGKAYFFCHAPRSDKFNIDGISGSPQNFSSCADEMIGLSPDRSEEDEYLDFAEWAFSPSGITSLKALAIGDFSFNSRYHNQQLLLRRSFEEPVKGIQKQQGLVDTAMSRRYFCVTSVDDPSLQDDLMVEGCNFLSACPEESLMDSPYE